MSNSLWPIHGLQHARLPCPSLSPGIHSNLYTSSQWCHPTHLILCQPLLPPSIFPTIRVFSNESAICVSGQSIRASASVLPMNIQGWFPLGLTGLISVLSEGLSRSSPAPQFKSISSIQGTLKSLLWYHSGKHQFFGAQSFLWSNSHNCTWLLEKPQLWQYGPLSAKWYLYFLICFLGFS